MKLRFRIDSWMERVGLALFSSVGQNWRNLMEGAGESLKVPRTTSGLFSERIIGRQGVLSTGLAYPLTTGTRSDRPSPP